MIAGWNGDDADIRGCKISNSIPPTVAGKAARLDRRLDNRKAPQGSYSLAAEEQESILFSVQRGDNYSKALGLVAIVVPMITAGDRVPI